MAEDSSEMILSPEELEALNGGFDAEQLTSEELNHLRELSKNLFAEPGEDRTSEQTREALKKVQDYVQELTQKYG